MAIRFYNSLSRTVEDFKPLVAGQVGMYCCGPTVHDFAHIGNFRAFTFYDLLRRYLTFRGFKVTYVMNITDVDDKIIAKLQKTNESLSEYTERYTNALFEDLKTLGVASPDIIPRATNEIEGMVTMVQTLLDRGHAYRVPSGDIYFKIGSCPGYGELANLSQQQLRENADGRVSKNDNYEKESVSDFALWKAYDPDDKEVFWETAIGKGRPGWHIECSAMSERYLGKTFDIHCGGIDLLFPHHTNEIAQSECAHGQRFVNYWLHSSHLMVDGKKMSKSLGNFYTLRDLLEKGIDPLSLRYEFLKTHYRQPIDFRFESLDQASAVVRRFSETCSALGTIGAGSGASGFSTLLSDCRNRFIEGLDNDLNISEALSAVHEVVTAINRDSKRLDAAQVSEAKKLLGEFDSVLGIVHEQALTIPTEISTLVQQRLDARKAKDFAKADELRAQITALGYGIKDEGGTTKCFKL